MTAAAPALATVVVATAARPDRLEECLTALTADRATTARQVVVVDNAPHDPRTRQVAERFDVELLTESRPGKSRALNTGVAAATGDVVLFLDDDVVVRPGWTDALAAAARRPGAGVVGGRVLARWGAPPPDWLHGPHAVHLTLVDHGPVDRVLPPPHFAFGAAMAVPAAVLRRLAPPFDPRLGPRPGLKLGHEEVHLAQRVRALGLPVEHCAAAVAEHRVDPERVDRARLRRIVLQSGVGAARRERLLGAPPATLVRRVAETVVSLLRAGRWTAVRGPVTADVVDRETGAWAVLGQRLERLAGDRAPGAVDRVASVLAGRGPA